MMWLLLCWSLLLWCLLSVPLSVLLGRCIAAAERGPRGAVAPQSVPRGAGAVQPVPPATVPAGWC